MEGSKDTHHTSPLRGYIPDQPLAPLFCFAFAIRIICHFTILRNQTVWGLFGGGARSLFDLSCGIFIHHEPRGVPTRDEVSLWLLIITIPATGNNFLFVPRNAGHAHPILARI